MIPAAFNSPMTFLLLFSMQACPFVSNRILKFLPKRCFIHLATSIRQSRRVVGSPKPQKTALLQRFWFAASSSSAVISAVDGSAVQF